MRLGLKKKVLKCPTHGVVQEEGNDETDYTFNITSGDMSTTRCMKCAIELLNKQLPELTEELQ